MFAYTDESGNTGLDLFHEDQPIFSTLTLLSPVELDELLAPRHAEWLAVLKTHRLHGSELGLRGIERIAASARQFIQLTDARFVLTLIHKPYFGAVKLVDTVLDSGINKAVHPLHYRMKALRVPLAIGLIANTTIDDIQQFWTAWSKGNCDSFVSVLQRVRVALREYPDARVRELLDDALAWAMTHPAAFMSDRRTVHDAPNIVALTLIIGALHEVVGTDGAAKILRFVHDQQQQFAYALKKTFEAVKHLAVKREPVASLIDFNIVKTFDCEIELVGSATSPTLQLVDCLLWLLQREEDAEEARALACIGLIDAVVERTIPSEFSFAQLARDASALRREVYKLPLSAEQAARGQRVMEALERERVKRSTEKPE